MVDENGCWLWQGYVDRNGYGTIRIGSMRDGTRRTNFTHIVAYQAFVGPVPEGLALDHSCDVRHCVNPEHLSPMTIRENLLKETSRSVAARNARKTHCKHGHPYEGDNLYLRPDGGRGCRICRRQATARHDARFEESPE